jgi:hypothetical protein
MYSGKIAAPPGGGGFSDLLPIQDDKIVFCLRELITLEKIITFYRRV